MSVAADALAQLRRPEYVGENRCVPCTIANVAIALFASLIVGGVVATAASLSVGVAAGGGLFAISAAVIYLRGYLVPGTPELTRRYFPQWLLAVFDKEPVVQDDTEGDINQEAVLVGAGALEECREGTDLCLVPEFRDAWRAEMQRIESEDDYSGLLSIVAVDEGDVAVNGHGSRIQATVDGRFAALWKSRAALRADLAGAALLSERLDNWAELDPHDRHALLAGLRLFIEECPECGAVPALEAETVETCCASQDVTVLDCPDCGARLFETAAQPAA